MNSAYSAEHAISKQRPPEHLARFSSLKTAIQDKTQNIALRTVALDATHPATKLVPMWPAQASFISTGQLVVEACMNKLKLQAPGRHGPHETL